MKALASEATQFISKSVERATTVISTSNTLPTLFLVSTTSLKFASEISSSSCGYEGNSTPQRPLTHQPNKPSYQRVSTGRRSSPKRFLAAKPHLPSRGAGGYPGGRTMVMIATAYTPGHGCGTITATGMRARYGVVAVDPRVIPLGTHLYIEGYGEAIAADTGSAIKGVRIDLCFDSLAQARAFGRRKVVVHIK